MISKEQLDLIQRFESAYNAIDEELRKRLNSNERDDFTSLLTKYENKARWFSSDAKELRLLAKLRNVIVHDRTKPYQYLSIPVPLVVEKIEGIYTKLTLPKTGFSEFGRNEVIFFQKSNTIEEVLRVIHTKDFSQFPVYEGSKFLGLLTENGITRWLSKYVVEQDSLIELKDVSVTSILEMEETSSNYQFFSRDTVIDEIVFAFKEELSLEAVLITQTGKPNEKLLGIATSWDILAF